MAEVICTICSREKDQRPGLLRADKRYLGEHVKEAIMIARRERQPLFILSGKYGLISVRHESENYDRRLTYNGVATLSKVVAKQIKAAGIEAIWYYHKPEESWMPYLRLLMEAAKETKVGFNLMLPSGHYAADLKSE